MEMKNNPFEKIKEKLKADKKALILIVCALAAMLVLFLSVDETKNKEESTTLENEIYNVFSEYENELTQRVKDLVSAVNGAGEVKVLLTLECYEEYVYAADEEYFENKSDENSNIERKNSYIVIDNDKLQEGVLLKIITPKIRGVGVVCEGGASAVIKHEISQIICAALGIGASQVHITN